MGFVGDAVGDRWGEEGGVEGGDGDAAEEADEDFAAEGGQQARFGEEGAVGVGFDAEDHDVGELDAEDVLGGQDGEGGVV